MFDTPTKLYPWTEERFGRLEDSHYFPSQVYYADPLFIPNLADLLEEASADGCTPVYEEPSKISTFGVEVHHQTDCFARLPLEIRDMILQFLPSGSVLNLELTSRAFATAPLTSSFWASRFSYDFEYNYIFEGKENLHGRANGRRWKVIFDGLRWHEDPAHIENRRRVWGLVRPLADALIAFDGAQCRGDSSPEPQSPDGTNDILMWRRASGLMEEGQRSYSQGCRTLFNRTACVSSRITGIYISIFCFHGTKFITGLRFVQEGSIIDLGYVSAGREVFLEIEPTLELDYGTKLNGLRGLNLATGQRGINAIQIVTDKSTSQWVGSPENLPRKRLLSTAGPITRLKGDFDVSSNRTPGMLKTSD